MTPEQDIQADIMKQTTHLVDWMRNNVGVAKTEGRTVRYGVGGKGGSDLIGIVRGTGRFVACEVKSEGGRPTQQQLMFLDRVRRSGGLAFIARSVDDVVRELEDA
jgi:hypothetical protein